MSSVHPEFIETPGFGEEMGNAYHHAQAFKLGNRIELSGHAGWTDPLGRQFPDDPHEQVRTTFDNIERTLNATGSSWREVVSLTSYHAPSTPGEAIDAAILTQIGEELRRRMGRRRPIWTAVGAGLVSPEMRIEIAVTAIVET